jgi:thiol-disulfide isomerase/thioredoxin
MPGTVSAARPESRPVEPGTPFGPADGTVVAGLPWAGDELEPGEEERSAADGGGGTAWSPGPASARRPFRWLGDEVAAVALARREHRALLVDFFAAWCPPCQLLEATTLRDPLVWTEIELAYVPLRIDVTEETARTKALLELFRVDALPALVVVDASGREIDRLRQYLPAAELAAWLAHAVGRPSRREPAAVEAN